MLILGIDLYYHRNACTHPCTERDSNLILQRRRARSHQ